MRTVKQNAVINAEKAQLDRIQLLIDSGRYRTVSEFAREAVEEKLERIDQQRVAEAVERYCAAGLSDEDPDLIEAQAFGGESRPAKPKGSRRAAR
jgi:Arc/MetJ-type ribon-helix-helix transcriptional regulator